MMWRSIQILACLPISGMLWCFIVAPCGTPGPLITKRTDALPQAKSRSREFPCKTFPIALIFGKHHDSGSAKVPVKCQSDRAIILSNFAASRLHEILLWDVHTLSEKRARAVLSDHKNSPATKQPTWLDESLRFYQKIYGMYWIMLIV